MVWAVIAVCPSPKSQRLKSHVEGEGTSDDALVSAWLVDRFHIRIRNVIGHNESLSSPYHKELYKPWAHQTHADWKHADMQVYRRKLRKLVGEDNSG